MITLKPVDYERVKFLLNQSLNGWHLAFDFEDLKPLLDKREIFAPIKNPDELKTLEAEIRHFFMLPNIRHSRDYFKKLDERRKIKLLKTYFNVVENAGYEQSQTMH